MKQKTAIVNPHKWKRLLTVSKQMGQEYYNLVYILFHSGMHISVYADPHGHNASFDGDILSWNRPKTRKRVVHRISITSRDPQQYARQIRWWLGNEWDRKTTMTYDRWLREIGKKAKINGLSSLTFRHTFCYRRLIETHGDMMRVKSEMQCSMGVLTQNYMLINPDQFS